MSIVIPKWWADKVKDWESLWLKTDDGSDELNEATCALLNYLAIVEITEINDENVEEVWRRIAIFQALFGSIYADQDNNEPLFITRSDVYRHIGIETEVKKITFESFCRKIISMRLAQEDSRLPSFIANGNRTLLSVVGIDETTFK